MPDIESIQRPERWSVPYSSEMTDEVVDRLLAIEPFCSLDAKKFRGKVTLRGILKNDTRLVSCQQGDIIVRQGDWGNSAFLILSGSVRVVLKSSEDFPSDILGRETVRRKNIFQILSQFWNRSAEPEVRNTEDYCDDPRIASRGDGQETRIYLQDVSAVLDKYQTAVLKEGQVFGELAALSRSSRQATVFADQECELLEIRWQGLRELMRRDDGLRSHIDKVFRERALPSFLYNTPILKHLDDEELGKLVQEAKLETYGQYDWVGSFKRLAKKGALADLAHEPLIASEGDYPNGVIIIRSGLARLSRRHGHGHRTIGYLSPGQIYGFNEIVDGWMSQTRTPLESSLRAIGITTVVVIPATVIEILLLDQTNRHDLQRFLTRSDSSVDHPVADVDRVNPEFVDFLVQNRYINGSQTMLIELDRCTRCDDCVRACASTHDNNPRFLRRGPIVDNVMVVNACMHCEDPVCMIECPTGAIHRNVEAGQVLINDRTCIGCGACATNCPYEAIRIVEVRNKQGEFIRDDIKHGPILKATKCDLCVDQYGGPACQRACPHDALVRMDMRDVSQLADWCNR